MCCNNSKVEMDFNNKGYQLKCLNCGEIIDDFDATSSENPFKDFSEEGIIASKKLSDDLDALFN